MDADRYFVGCHGVPSGVVIGHTYDGAVPAWEVIKHKGNNFSVRQAGCDSTSGIVIPVPERHAYVIFNKLGVFRLRGQSAPWDEASVTWQCPDRRSKIVKISAFVEAAWELFEVMLAEADRGQKKALAH